MVYTNTVYIAPGMVFLHHLIDVELVNSMEDIAVVEVAGQPAIGYKKDQNPSN
jgi:hypothetical protein